MGCTLSFCVVRYTEAKFPPENSLVGSSALCIFDNCLPRRTARPRRCEHAGGLTGAREYEACDEDKSQCPQSIFDTIAYIAILDFEYILYYI